MEMLVGKVAIVTGAGRGVGRAEALMLAKYGAKVIVNDLGVGKDGIREESSPAQQVVNEIVAAGGEAVANGADISDWDQAEALINQAADTFGRLDILVNNAGILRDRMLWNMTEQDFDLVVKVNLKGTFACLHHAAVYWRQQNKAGNPVAGRIINTSSSVGIFGNVGQVNYAAAKAGVIGFSKSMAREVASRGITINVVAPGFIDTDMTKALTDDQKEAIFKDIPANRLGEPDEIAATVAFLVSDGAAYITGETIHVNGGMYMG